MNYAERDIAQLDEEGGFYARHIQAMTAEKLHDRGDIAAELGWRDAQVVRLKMLRGLDEDRYQALLDRCNELEAISAAMLQRWAVIHNLAQTDGLTAEVHGAVFGVASLSAEECVADGGRAGGARLMRQERAARVLLELARHLNSGASIDPGSQLAHEVMTSAVQLSSYPQLSPVSVGKAGDCAPQGLSPGPVEPVREKCAERA